MTKKCFSILLLVLLSSSPLPLWASAGTSGASFLEIPVGAAPAALGGAYSALATDAYSPVWNPAGLGFLESNEVAGQHLSYLESMNYEFASFVHPFGGGRSLGAAVQYFSTGDIPGTDPTGASTGDFSSHYGAYSLAYGQTVNDRLAFGLATKWIHAKISDTSANAYAVDLGAFYKATHKLDLAVTASNMGSPLKFVSQKDELPLAFHLSGAYKLLSTVLIAAEGVYAREGTASFRTGAEWRPLHLIAFRTGYRTDTLEDLSPLAGFSTGVALTAWGQEFAYAWLPYDDLGSTHYFSLVMRFGAKGEHADRNIIQSQMIRPHGAETSAEADNDAVLDLLQKDDSFVNQQPSLRADSTSYEN